MKIKGTVLALVALTTMATSSFAAVSATAQPQSVQPAREVVDSSNQAIGGSAWLLAALAAAAATAGVVAGVKHYHHHNTVSPVSP